MKLTKLLFATTAAVLVCVGSASANPVLRLDVISPIPMALPSPFPAPPVLEIADNGMGDLNPAVGLIGFIGAVQGFNVTIGGVGGGANPGAELDLVSVAVSTFGGANQPASGALELTLSEQNLNVASGANLLNFFSAIGGTTQGRVSYWMYVDDGNNLFGLSQLIRMGTFTGTPGNNAFEDDASALRSITDTFSMTLRVVIEHGDGTRTTSFDFNGMTGRIPEPSTLLLFGIGVLGLAMLRRRT